MENSTPIIACRICGHTAKMVIYHAREMMFGTREMFEYFQCSECACLQILEVPKDPIRFYPKNYYSFRIPQFDNRNWFVSFLQKQRSRAALFGIGIKLSRFLGRFVAFPDALFECGQLIQGAKIKDFNIAVLDVGCGTQSWWLNGLQALGFRNLLGIDPFIARDTKVNGYWILKKSIGEIERRFSLITFHHSLEHMPDQLRTMCQVRRILDEGGVCLVRLPIIGKAWEKYGVNWVEMDPPRHFYLHSRKSLDLLAERSGMEIVDHFTDTSEFEFIGSEQYLRDIPLMSDKSYYVDPYKGIFSDQQVKVYREKAKKLNAVGEGARGVFYLKCRS